MQNNKKDEEDISAYYPDGDAENMEKDDLQEEFYSKNQKKKNKIKKKNARLTKSQVALIAVIFIQYRFQKSRLCTVPFFPYPIE